MAIHTLLVVKPSSLGDIVHTLPAAAFLKRAFPDARLRWLINTEWAPLLAGNPDVDTVIPFPRRELGGAPKVLRQVRWLRKLRGRYRSDLVLDFQGLLRSAIAGRACRGQDFLGLSDAREGARFFYDGLARVDRCEHAVARYLKLAALAGADTSGPLEWKLPAGTPPARFAEGDDAAPFLLLHPFSRGPGKSLPVREVEAFCRALPFPVVVVGRTHERLAPAAHVVDLLNQTSIPELIWLIRRARFVVSVDSGPMHLAAALGKPLLSLHTWSDPARVGPYHPDAWVFRDRAIFRMRRLLAPGGGDRQDHHDHLAPDVHSLAEFVTRQWER